MEKEHAFLLTKHIKPDYAFYIQGDDRLYVAAYSSVASLTVRFSGYFLSYNGEVRQYAVDVFPTSNRAVTSVLQFLGEGFILSCTAYLLSGNANRGQCYVRARIQRGTATTIVPIVALLSGYVSDEYQPSFPYGKLEGPLEGPGMIRNLAGTNPAAGVEITETVPTGARWRLMAFNIQLTTDGTVANRFLAVAINGASASAGVIVNTQAQVASTTVTYDISLGVDRAYLVGILEITMPLPAVILLGGSLIYTYCVGMVAGDNYAAPTFHVEEWLEA